MASDDFELKISAAEISVLVGAKYKEIDNWLQRPELFNRFKSTRTGARRSMSRSNVLELAFLAAFVKAGFKVTLAIRLAAAFVRLEGTGKIREWIVLEPNQDPETARHLDELPPTSTLTFRASNATPTLLVIFNVGETVRRIDTLFSTKMIRHQLKQ